MEEEEEEEEEGGENPSEASSGGDDCSERMNSLLQACCQLTVCCQPSDAATINVSASPLLPHLLPLCSAVLARSPSPPPPPYSSLLLPVQPDLPFPLLFSSSNFQPPFPLFPHALSHPAFIIPPPPPFLKRADEAQTKQMNDFGPSVTRQL